MPLRAYVTSEVDYCTLERKLFLMKAHAALTIMAVGAFLLSGAMVNAQIPAYDSGLLPGNQAWTGNLGLDFDVGSRDIIVTNLGVFDNFGNGFQGSVTVGIFDRDSGVQVSPSVTIFGTGGTLVNGDRFVSISPVRLPAGGHFSVVAVGFSATDLNGNAGCVGNAVDACVAANPFAPSIENTGGGLISFVGHGRYDANTTLDFPVTIDPAAISNPYLAGTFQFQGLVAPPVTKSFPTPNGSPNVGSTVPAQFSVSNPNPVPLTGVTFTDVLPSGLQVQSPNGLTGSCTAGSTGSVPTTTNTITFNGTLAPGGSCTFSVNTVAIAQGPQTNGPITVSSNEAPPGTSAPASLFVSDWWLWFFYST